MSSTASINPGKRRLSQIHLALNGWVGTVPMLAMPAVGQISPGLMGPRKMNCQPAATREGQPLPLPAELGQYQD